jgi:hypothetical protein
MVWFIPADDLGRQGACGGTDARGRFQLGTLALRDGALPGEYKVLVVPRAQRPLPAGRETGRCSGAGQVRSPATDPPVPAVYTDPARTPLRCRISGAWRLVLELRSTGGTAPRSAYRWACPGDSAWIGSGLEYNLGTQPPPGLIRGRRAVAGRFRGFEPPKGPGAAGAILNAAKGMREVMAGGAPVRTPPA